MSENINKKITRMGVEICSRIVSARKKAGLSQAQLAELIGKNTNTVNRYERCLREVSAEEILRLATALKCNPCWLLTGEGPGEMPVYRQDFEDGVAIFPDLLGGDTVMRMEGDAMSPRIHSGDFVIVKADSTKPGDVVVVTDEWDGKHVRWQREADGQTVFVAEHHDYRPMVAAAVTIIGRVVATVHVNRY